MSLMVVVVAMALVTGWGNQPLRAWLLAALTSHVVMRVWSALDFIPKALAFERAEPTAIDESAARRWARRSTWRLPLDIVTCAALIVSLAVAARSG